ncbi:F-box/LRR-repeat protein 14-like [Zootermopsis nevadensis]|uniref:Leucine-rich repeat-containing protein 29 n=1 Tax=Zootermopsis nevadensis TaxID=136037 RepID=A0A067QMJ0_ZOONE|nr:F-box/LRR-repeat protein 14-like [Zootermopsis nevadensis]KDR09426.1 Leucine-rich repeat-containing protein 29 [Zootermopsis nevadensis]
MESAITISSGSRHRSTKSDEFVELPIEIIIYILQFLSLSDRISASQVCHLWHMASKVLKLHSNELVVLQDDLTRPLQVLENSLGTFLHFVFKEVELGGKLTKFWDRFCPQMQSLSLHTCDISEKTFVHILLKCSHLETLSVNGCRELLMSGRVLEQKSDVILLSKTLVKLRKLSLASNRYLSDALFNRFVAISSNLEDLSLTGCQISFHFGLCKKFYPGDMLKSGYIMASESVLTFSNILQYVVSQAGKIRKLRFGDTLIDNAALSQLAEVPELCLETLHLQSCEQLNNTGILRLTEYQQSLTELDLSNCSRIGDPSFIAICHNLKNLLILNMEACCAITNTGISELCHLTKLVNLNLSHCDQVSGEGIERGLCSSVNLHLQRLNLAALSLDERTVCLIAKNLPRLIYLDLGWCFNAVTDMSIQAICQHQLWLRSLKLTRCDQVTDAGLTGLGLRTRGSEQAEEQKHETEVRTKMEKQINGLLGTSNDGMPHSDRLHRISLRSKAEQDIVNDAKRKKVVLQMCEDQDTEEVENGFSIVRLKGLQELDLRGCNRITDVSLKYAFSFLELRHLNLSLCQQVTDTGISDLASKNPSIETLIMIKCHNITDSGMIKFVTNLSRLKHLELQGCSQLTDASLTAIGQRCSNLKYLDISYCSGMSLEGSEHMELCLPSLYTLYKRGLASKEFPKSSVKEPKQVPPPPKFRFLL